ncbi:MAG: alpha/beta fold hydrolase [Phycisphaerales bacterium]|nr:alpha/beta fold hydrolase [Phycisphaerales bacterium]
MDTPLSELKPGDHLYTLISSVDRSEQPFRLFLPKAMTSGKALPLLVVLHGKGVDHNAWFDLTGIKDAGEQHSHIVVAPNGRGEKYYDGNGERDVLDIIDRICQDLRVDTGRVYLAGHSMGGWGTWHIASRNVQRFATICPMAAPAPLDALPHLGGLDPLIIHDRDDDVVPVTQSRRAAATLAEHGISFRYWERQGYKHRSAIITDSLPQMFAWFADHRQESK